MSKVNLSEIKLDDRGRQEQDVLSLEVRHSDGCYKLTVKKETHKELEPGGTMYVECLLFADGNFNYKLLEGRKSQKKLDKFNDIIEANKEHLTELWKNSKYTDICNEVYLKAVQSKLI